MMDIKAQRYMLLCFSMTLLSMEALNPFLPLYVKSLVGQNFHHYLSIISATAISAPMIGMILFSPFWGRMADTYGSKPMVLRAGLALSICQLLIAMTTQIEWFITIRFLQGVFAGFITAMQTYAVDSSYAESKGVMLARLQTAKSAASALGGSIGGLVLSYYTYNGLFYLSSLTCLLGTLIFWHKLPDTAHHHVRRASNRSAFKPLVMILLVVVFLSQVAKFLPQSVFAFYVVSLGGQSKALLGLLYAAPAISILFTAELSGRLFDKLRREHSTYACLLFFLALAMFACVVLLLQYFSHQLWQVLCCRLLWGVALGAFLPALYTLLADLVPNRGYIIGMANSSAKAGNLSGILMGALLVGQLHFDVVFLVMAMVYLSMVLVMLVEMVLLRQVSWV